LTLVVDPRNLTEAGIEHYARAAVPEGAAPPTTPDVMSASAQEGRPPRDFRYEQERLQFARDCEIADSGKFGEVLTHPETGETISYAALAMAALPAQEQLELSLEKATVRQHVRLQLAEKIERDVIPLLGAPWVHRIIDQLRIARHHADVFYDFNTNKYVPLWDAKAGLARYCPDDAREEAQRVVNKYRPVLLEHQAAGYNIYTCVLTAPNVPAGGLAKEQERQFRAFRKMLKRRYPDGSLVFPEIAGALVVQESPLGGYRDWHVHLNAILVVRGTLHWGKLRSRWGANLEIDQVAGGKDLSESQRADAMRGALTELIKYPVTPLVVKSAKKVLQHSRDPDRPPAPSMLEYTGSELLEWMRSQRGFRRTRSYGCLFKIKKPEPLPAGPRVFIGRLGWDRQRYQLTLAPLIGSIPEDKSTPLAEIARYVAMLRGLSRGKSADRGLHPAPIPPHLLDELEF
jgi:hypothetical protein